MFIGTLVERAREVQQQWAAIETPPETPGGPKQLPDDTTDLKAGNASADVTMQNGTDEGIDPELIFREDWKQLVNEPKKEPSLGPLLPDHLREALRRYRRDGEGGGTGLTGFSVGLGVPGTGSARLQDKRLFK